MTHAVRRRDFLASRSCLCDERLHRTCVCRSKLNHSASLLAILAVFLSLGGCSRDNIAQAKPVSVPLPYPTQAEEVGQEEQVEFVPATVGFAEGKAQEDPKDIIAAQIRSQGYACNSTQSAERDAEASAANQAVWMLRCQNASYRVTLIPNLAAKVEKVGEEVRREVQKVTAPADNPPAIAGSQ